MNVTQVGNSAVIVAVHKDRSLWFYYSGIPYLAGIRRDARLIYPTWNPGQEVSGPDSASSASIAQVGNSSVIATVGAKGGLWYYWQPIDANGWNREKVASPNTASSVSVTQVGNSSVIAAVHEDGSLWYYWQAIDAKGWNPEQVSGPNTVSAASVAQVGNSSVIVAVQKDGSLWYYWQPIDASGWNPEQVAGPALGEAAIREASVTQAVDENTATAGPFSLIAAVDSLDTLSTYWQAVDSSGWVGPMSVATADIRV